VLDDLAYRIALHVLHQHEVLLAVKADLDERVSATDDEAQRVGLERDVQGRLAVAVNNGRGLPDCAELTCPALAEVFACNCLELKSAHNGFLLVGSRPSSDGNTPSMWFLALVRATQRCPWR